MQLILEQTNDSDKCRENADKLKKKQGSTGEQCLNTYVERGLVWLSARALAWHG